MVYNDECHVVRKVIHGNFELKVVLFVFFHVQAKGIFTYSFSRMASIRAFPQNRPSER